MSAHLDRQERQIRLPYSVGERVRKFLSRLRLTKAPEPKVKLLFQQGILENDEEFAARVVSRIVEQNNLTKTPAYQEALIKRQKLDELLQGYPTVQNSLVEPSVNQQSSRRRERPDTTNSANADGAQEREEVRDDQ